MLKKRVLTAIILIPFVFLWVFKFPPSAFEGVLLTFFGGAIIEWDRLSKFKKWWAHGVFAGGLLILLWILRDLPVLFVLGLGSIFWLLPLYSCATYRGETKGWFARPVIRGLLGWISLGFAYQALITLRALPQGPLWVIFLFLLIWASDSGAYFSGRQWGKHRLASFISPNKTLEGLVGGIVAAMIVAGGVYYYFFPFLWWWGIAFITILLGVLGDLFESLLKRTADVKDSGQLLPGHGGVLDRIDSLLAALPFYTLCIVYGGKG